MRKVDELVFFASLEGEELLLFPEVLQFVLDFSLFGLHLH